LHRTLETIVEQPRETRRALLIMVAAAVMFGGMAFTAKLASTRLSGPQVALVRASIGLLPVLFIATYRPSKLKFQRYDLLIYRGLFGGLSVLFYFIAISHISPGVATLLNYTAPIWAGIFSALFIGERISAKVLLFLPIALIGVTLVVQSHASPGEVLGFGRWELSAACSAIASGAAVTAMRAARRTESSWAVYASFCVFGFLVSLPLAAASWKTPTAGEWVALLATALLAMGAQLSLTFSLRWVDAVTVGVISQLAVLTAMSLGATFLGETITAWTALGAFLTIAGVTGVVYITSLSKPRVAADEVVPEA
jgi:drug/metabolite transporter (DMT)-like permease